jgi:hypothetical protein
MGDIVGNSPIGRDRIRGMKSRGEVFQFSLSRWQRADSISLVKMLRTTCTALLYTAQHSTAQHSLALPEQMKEVDSVA